MWQEFKKLGSACCTVRRREFIWGYDSGFGSAANFWHCSPLQPRPSRSNMCNTAIDEMPILTTSFKTTQRGRDFSPNAFTPGWNYAQIFCRCVQRRCRGCTLSEKVSFASKKIKNFELGSWLPNAFQQTNQDESVNDADRNVAQWQHGRDALSQHEVLFTQTTGLLGGPAGPAHLQTSAAPQAVTIHHFDKASIVQVQAVEIRS